MPRDDRSNRSSYDRNRNRDGSGRARAQRPGGGIRFTKEQLAVRQRVIMWVIFAGIGLGVVLFIIAAALGQLDEEQVPPLALTALVIIGVAIIGPLGYGAWVGGQSLARFGGWVGILLTLSVVGGSFGLAFGMSWLFWTGVGVCALAVIGFIVMGVLRGVEVRIGGAVVSQGRRAPTGKSQWNHADGDSTDL